MISCLSTGIKSWYFLLLRFFYIFMLILLKVQFASDGSHYKRHTLPSALPASPGIASSSVSTAKFRFRSTSEWHCLLRHTYNMSLNLLYWQNYLMFISYIYVPIPAYRFSWVTVLIARQHTAADKRYWYSNSVHLSVRPSVRLSVRLSVRDTLVLYENGLTYRHSFSTIR